MFKSFGRLSFNLYLPFKEVSSIEVLNVVSLDDFLFPFYVLENIVSSWWCVLKSSMVCHVLNFSLRTSFSYHKPFKVALRILFSLLLI